MKAGGFQLLLIPSVEHIYKEKLRQMYTFLMVAQEAHIDIVCLEPEPASVYTQRLEIMPQAINHTTTVEEIVRCLRALNIYGEGR